MFLNHAVSRVLRDGYGYVQPRGSSQEYVFSFRTIPNYHGETARELNIHPGAEVRFKADGQQVTRLIIGSDFSKFLEDRGVTPDTYEAL